VLWNHDLFFLREEDWILMSIADAIITVSHFHSNQLKEEMQKIKVGAPRNKVNR
jgi:hypothetical protein